MCTHVLETLALVVLQQAVLAAELAVAEATLANDPLYKRIALANLTSRFLGGSHVDVSKCRSRSGCVCLCLCLWLWLWSSEGMLREAEFGRARLGRSSSV